jgi:hypothetical protein
MLNCCVVLISALLPGKIKRNRIKSYWNAGALVNDAATDGEDSPEPFVAPQ